MGGASPAVALREPQHVGGGQDGPQHALGRERGDQVHSVVHALGVGVEDRCVSPENCPVSLVEIESASSSSEAKDCIAANIVPDSSPPAA